MLSISEYPGRKCSVLLRPALLVVLGSLTTLVHSTDLNIPIIRSVPGDKGTYFLIEVKRSGALITSVHKRIGVNETGYSRVGTNCNTRQYRDVGYGEDGPASIKGITGNWTSLVEGSSKSDLVRLVCQRF